MTGTVRFRRMVARAPQARVRAGRDGIVYLSHPASLRPAARNLIDLLVRAIRKHGPRPFLHERVGEGWRGLTYDAFGEAVARRAGALAGRGVEAGEVVAILSGNSLDHAVTSFAVMALGAVVAPLSPAHLAHAAGRTLLRDLYERLGARKLFIDAALAEPVAEAGFEAPVPLGILDEDLVSTPIDLAAAARRILPEAGAKIFFTSGSTGTPKAVVNSHRMLTASAAMVDAVSPRLPMFARPAVLDWLPWHHTYGGNINLHAVMLRGGAFYSDDGLPTPDRFARTLKNLAEVQPTQITNVPVAYPMLIAALRNDPALAKRVLKNVRACSFGGAALSPSVVADFQTLAVETLGERIMFGSGYGMTETTGIIALVYWRTDRTDLLGLPLPGETVKLVPCDDGRFECRVAGPNLFSGYLAGGVSSVFDEEGYFLTGDAVRPADPDDWSAGLIYDGRLAEDFKLSNGVWVRAGPMREVLLDALRPHAADLLLCGANREAVGALVWPAPGATAETRAALQSLARTFNRDRTTASTRIARLAIAASAPTPAEMTAKGTLNPGRVAVHRAAEIDALFLSPEAAL